MSDSPQPQPATGKAQQRIYPVSQGSQVARGAFTNGQPWLGGRVYLLAGPISSGSAQTITHTLRRKPVGAITLDAGTGYQPRIARGSTWNASQVQVVPDTAVASGQTWTIWLF